MTSHLPVAPDLIRGLAFLRRSSEKAVLACIGFAPTVVLISALLPASALAQCKDAEQDCITVADLRDDAIVVTATGAEQRVDKSGQAITTILREEIEQRQTSSVAELLAQTPGITISRNGGPGQTAAVRIRGAEDSHALVLIDGVRVNDPGAPAGAFDFGNLSIGNIDRIEVLRGPNSVPWGSAAIGGVVNIVTGSAQGLRANAEYGSRNAAQFVAQGGTRIGPVTASVGGGYFTDDGISAFKGGQEPDPFRRWALNGRAGVELGRNLILDLRGWYADSKVSFDGFPPPTYAFADTRQYSKTRQSGSYVGLDLTTGPVKHRLAFTMGDTARDSIDPDNSFNNFISRGRSERIEYRADADISAGVRAVVGAEHEWTRFRDAFDRYSTRATSGYAQLVVTPADPVTLTGGVRVDDYKTYGTKATASANAAWRIGGDTIVRAAYGEGFKAPSLFQLYSFYGKPIGSGIDPLQPETARSYEIGIEQNMLHGVLRFGLTVFRRDTRNQINFVNCPNPTDALCATKPFGYYDNIDRSRAEGLESFVALRPSDALTLTANYTLTDARNRVTNKRLLRRPLHSFNASIDWSGPLKLGADLHVVSDSRDLDFVSFMPTSLDGYALVTLRAALPLQNGIELYGRVENLLNARYETVSGYGTPRRSAYLGVRVRF